MKRILGLIGLLIMCQLTKAQTTIVQGLQINGAKGAPPSTSIPTNGGIAIFDANGVLKKTTVLASLGNKLTSVTALNDSTLTIVGDGGSTTVLVRGLFTLSRQRWFDSLRLGLVFDTISVHQVGVGVNTVYSNALGTALLVKGLQGSTTIGVQRNADSSLTLNSLLTFSRSTTISNSGDVGLVGDLTTPTTNSVYGTQSGSKGWYLVSSFPVATNNTNGIMDYREKLRLDSTVTFTNSTNGGIYDSIAVASPTLDSVIFKGLNLKPITGSGVLITKTGNLFLNEYSFNIDNTLWLKGQAGIATKSGDGSTVTFTIAHGLTGVTTSSPVLVTAKSAAAMGFFWATVDATNITITYGTGTIPVTGTNNLTWSYIIKP